MNNKRRNIIIVACFAAAAGRGGLGIFLLWKPEPKGIVVAVSSLPDSVNPVLGQNVFGLDADELVFDGLVNFEVNPQSGTLYPELALAEAIEQDPDTKKDLFGPAPAGVLARRHGVHRGGRGVLLRRLCRRKEPFAQARLPAVIHQEREGGGRAHGAHRVQQAAAALPRLPGAHLQDHPLHLPRTEDGNRPESRGERAEVRGGTGRDRALPARGLGDRQVGALRR